MTATTTSPSLTPSGFLLDRNHQELLQSSLALPDSRLIRPVIVLRNLLVFELFLLQACVSSGLFGADPAEQPELVWQTAFAPVSAGQASETLILLLITNDDGFIDRSAPGGEQPEAEPEEVAQHAWCARDIEQTCKLVVKSRPDLEQRLRFQSIFAGIPSELTGGATINSPARVVLFVCDGNYKLLALTAGIPNQDKLLTLLEDAQEVKTLLDFNDSDPSKVTDAIVQRSKQRIGRLWNQKLQHIAQTAARERDLILEGAAAPMPTLVRLQQLFLALQPTYMQDVKTRFGLSKDLDARRLVILEQHSESRDPWCQSVMPFIIGMDVQKDWQMFVELLWNQYAIPTGSDQTELLAWFDEQRNAGPLVLAITAPSYLQHKRWPPNASKSQRGTSWQQTHDVATEFPFRAITPQQLTELIRQREFKSINCASPSMVRYLLVSPDNRLPQIIREQDPPARFLGLLRRAKTTGKSAQKTFQKEEIR